MISYNNPDKSAGKFDQVLRVALRQSVRGEEPSTRVRELLLRAAAAQRLQQAPLAQRRPSRPNWTVRARGWSISPGMWHDSVMLSPGNIRTTVETTNAQLIWMRLSM